MSFQVLALSLAFLVLVWWGIEELLIRKKPNIKIKILYRHVNATHRRVEYLFLVAFLVIGSLISPTVFRLAFPVAFLVLFAFRAFMEWKFEKGSKRYIGSLIVVGISIVAAGVIWRPVLW